MKFNLFVLASLISGMCFGNWQNVSFTNLQGHEYTGACSPYVQSPLQFIHWKNCIQRLSGNISQVVQDDSSALWRYFQRDCNTVFNKAYSTRDNKGNIWFKCLSRSASNAEVQKAGNQDRIR
jgi:hypothetical protein